MFFGTVCTFAFLARFSHVFDTEIMFRSTRLPDIVIVSVGLLVATFSILRTWAARHRTRREVKGAPVLVGAFAATALAIVLGYVTLPSVHTPRYVDHRRQCKFNLKIIGLAMHNYYDIHASFPIASAGTPPVSWRVAVLPYMEHADIYQQYDQLSSWDSTANLRHSKTVIPSLDCPQRPKGREFNERGQFLTAYVVPTGIGSVFEQDEGSTFSDITDGTSNTIMAVEACGTDVVWTEPRDADIQATPIAVNAPSDRIDYSDGILSSWHGGGAHSLRADGSVYFVSQNIDRDVLKALLTKAVGDDTDEY